MSEDWKKRLGTVYSTNQNFEYQNEQDIEEETLDPGKQRLLVKIDRRQRAGKQVTLITGFVGTDDALKDLSKLLKTQCGVGGSCKDGEIIIQGDFRDKIVEILNKKGYGAKRGN